MQITRKHILAADRVHDMQSLYIMQALPLGPTYRHVNALYPWAKRERNVSDALGIQTIWRMPTSHPSTGSTSFVIQLSDVIPKSVPTSQSNNKNKHFSYALAFSRLAN